jgi:hypothetical protein
MDIRHAEQNKLRSSCPPAMITTLDLLKEPG